MALLTLRQITPFLLHRPLHFSKTPTKTLISTTIKMQSWTCSTCTFINPPSQKSSCAICLTAAPKAQSSHEPPKPKWPCAACTFLNHFQSSRCDVCGTRAPAASLSSILETEDDDRGIDPEVGTVFWPLRGCSSGNSSVRKFGSGPENGSGLDDPDDDVGSRARSGERKRKGREDEVEVVDDDVFAGFKDVKTGKCVANESIMDLEAPSKTCLGKDSKVLKVLTYNVWFREDLEMRKRMNAIGNIIQLHSPDVICFQEVIPDIYDIFQQSSWWKAYSCSVPRELASNMGYFCMQLTKLPVKSFSCKPFHNSIMGRKLCIAEVEVEKGQGLVVATSHLESPCPAPPKWDQMFSKERVVQANEAINLLQKSPNVIFCGDMNWDDKLDGPFPLPEGWVDAWTELRHGEIGYTYDTKSNAMLTGNRSLQKRLDRFLCCLKDFKISKIEMVGKDPIPGLFYSKQKKIRSEIKNLTLPVLPSDHYGLLLEICVP